MEDGEKIVAKDRGKSKSSLRALPLDATVKERLLAIRETQEMYRKKFKGSYNKKWIGYVRSRRTFEPFGRRVWNRYSR